jgi:hypothetical protein
MAIESYEVLKDSRPDRLVTRVTAAIAAGKQPFGPPVGLPDGTVAQAVITGQPLTEIPTVNYDNVVGKPDPEGTAGAVPEPGEGEGAISAVETGDEIVHTTRLTLADFLVGLSGDDAAKSFGKLAYTFPEGDIVVLASSIKVALQIDDAIDTDEPEVGLGTVEADDTEATLGADDALTENIFEGEAGPAVDSSEIFYAAKFPMEGVQPLFIDADEPHTVFLNLADTWEAMDGDAPAAVTASGEIMLHWMRLNQTPPEEV